MKSDSRLNNNSPALSETAPEPAVVGKKGSPVSRRPEPRVSFFQRVLRFFGQLICVVLATALVAVGALYGVMSVLTHGPSETARNLFVMSVRETSAIGFLADLFLSEEQIAQIEAGRDEVEYIRTDTSLVNINAGTVDNDDGGESSSGPASNADAWGLVDDDGDGIILETVKGEGYSGYMMVVLDPSRVIVGFSPEDQGRRGYTVGDFVEYYGAVAGTNAGGFEDENGQGNGSLPDSMVVYEGQQYSASKGVRKGFFGLDSNHILHVGLTSIAAVKEADIQYGCAFGPVLVSNGEGVDPTQLASGVNPRTAIGQRSDGAILLLVIDGRQVISLGATYVDEMEIMLRYGAVNAINLDGGSSSMMYYNGEYVNNSASVIGLRPVPTSIIVLKEGAKTNGEN